MVEAEVLEIEEVVVAQQRRLLVEEACQRRDRSRLHELEQ